MTHARVDLETVETDADRTDLSAAFGESAADSLRGLLAPRRAPVRAVDEPGPDTPTPEEAPDPATERATAVTPGTRSARPVRRTPERAAPSRTTTPGRSAPGRATPAREAPDRTTPSRTTRSRATPGRPATPSGRTRDGATPGREAPSGAATAPAPRPRTTQVRDREDVGLLLLAVVGDGVANGREIAALVRDRSGGTVEVTERSVYQELNRLRHNRLIADTGRGAAARFVLTDSGERILRARARRWQAYARGMGRVLGSEPPTTTR